MADLSPQQIIDGLRDCRDALESYGEQTKSEFAYLDEHDAQIDRDTAERVAHIDAAVSLLERQQQEIAEMQPQLGKMQDAVTQGAREIRRLEKALAEAQQEIARLTQELDEAWKRTDRAEARLDGSVSVSEYMRVIRERDAALKAASGL